MLIASMNELAADPEKYAVHPSKDFSRNRKMGFKDFLLMFLTMEADCIKEELYRYFGRSTDAPSKAAFYKQRKKLRNGALRWLLLSFNQNHVDRILSKSQSKKKRLHPELSERYRYICPDVPMDYITGDNPEYGLYLRIVR